MEREWPAKEYEIGSYIQAAGATAFLPKLHLQKTDAVLDVGCGNGAFTRRILEQVPHGSVMGIDTSENMLALAKKVIKDFPNFSVKKENVLTMRFENVFDKVVSFWCLQWAPDIHLAFQNIFNALKKGGQVFTLFPAGDDPFIMAYYALRDSGKFSCLKNFKAPVDYSRLANLAEKLKNIPNKKYEVTKESVSLTLPNLNTFRKFVYGISFYQGQVAEFEVRRLNEEMINWYENQCVEKWNGKYAFDFSLYLVTGEKS
ncbi:Putative methyltransferase (plasmid) [Legionella adelaidensis]|uniref:Methyltransferase n=1 Tax=Legionella adelaidensis TaxID=45056 RepID=A0A0W0R654_9GAMM|nr:class I SAM-dependent methyltransferase [Legionella adelaidensis]KTC66508.1 putative methyltransferase [Legionella adelaidensis]VEH85795.1 Putative methyltransferase [Legionella adelaidensis]